MVKRNIGGLIGVMRGVITSTRSSTPASSNGAGVGNLGLCAQIAVVRMPDIFPSLP